MTIFILFFYLWFDSTRFSIIRIKEGILFWSQTDQMSVGYEKLNMIAIQIVSWAKRTVNYDAFEHF